MRDQLPDSSRLYNTYTAPGAAVQARIGLLLGIVGLGLLLIPAMSFLIGLLLPPLVSPSPIGVYLFPICLALSFLFSLVGVIFSATARHTPEQEKHAQRAVLLTSIILALSFALGMIYLMAITAGFS
jgi:hypothetical protein